MPIYEYECPVHGKFESLGVMSQCSEDQSCPECGTSSRRVISAWARATIANWDTVVGHDGNVLSRRQSTEEIPMEPERVHGGRY